MTKNTQHADSLLIDVLGGTGNVAALCECSPAAISQWRHKGIPKARRLHLQAIHPELFDEVTLSDEESSKAAN